MSGGALTLRGVATVLGGEVSGGQVHAPGPGHSPGDRSLSVRLVPGARSGFIVNSFAGDDWRVCRDYVLEKLGMPDWRPTPDTRTLAKAASTPADNHAKAGHLWRRRRATEGTPAETYLREVRGYSGPIPLTLGFLPAYAGHPPALISVFGIATEPKPDILLVAETNIRGVHLTRLLPDGSGKGSEPSRIMLGRSTGSPIVLAPFNDQRGLFICEGVETGLSLAEATGCGVWAAGSAGRMPALADAVPKWVDTVTVVGESDTPGRRGAAGLVAGLRASGIPVELLFLGEAP